MLEAGTVVTWTNYDGVESDVVYLGPYAAPGAFEGEQLIEADGCTIAVPMRQLRNKGNSAMSNEIRFYAADLAAYNNGVLHGVWINADTDVGVMQDGINAMLRKSPYPNVMVEDLETGKQVPSAEEWAMHDSEGLPKYFGEYSGLKAIAEYMELAEEQDTIDNDNLRAIVDDYGSVENARTALEDNFCGIYDSFKDYAEETADEQIDGLIKGGASEWLTRYFDHDAFARDLKFDMHTIELPDGDVAVFYA